MKNAPHFRLKNFIHCNRIEPVYRVIHKTTYLGVTKNHWYTNSPE